MRNVKALTTLALLMLFSLKKQYIYLICIDASRSISSAQLMNIRKTLVKEISTLPKKGHHSIVGFGNMMIIQNDVNIDKVIPFITFDVMECK